jgi:hypothetical protein
LPRGLLPLLLMLAVLRPCSMAPPCMLLGGLLARPLLLLLDAS